MNKIRKKNNIDTIYLRMEAWVSKPLSYCDLKIYCTGLRNRQNVRIWVWIE